MRLRSWWSVHVVVALALVAACGDSKKEVPDGSAPPTREVVGPEGGTVEYEGLALEIPPGALSEEVEISIARSADAPSGNFVRLSPVFRFEPDGLTFAVPATVRFPLPDGARSPGIYWASAGAPFQRIGGSVEEGTIAGEVSHFSTGFVGDPPESKGGALRPVLTRNWSPGGGHFSIGNIEATPDGGVLAWGPYSGNVDLGGGVASPGTSGWMVVRFAPDGAALWARELKNVAPSFGVAAALPDGGVVLASFKNIVGLGADGAVAWRIDVKGGGEIWPSHIAVDDGGRIALVGTLNGTVDLGPGPFVAEGGGQASFFAIIGPDGKLRHAVAHGPVDGGSVEHQMVVAAPNGGFLVVGHHSQAVDLGGGLLAAPGSPRFSFNLHLAEFDESGTHKWSVPVEVKTGKVRLASLSIDESGPISLFADYEGGAVEIGEWPISTEWGGGVVRLSFDPQDGAFLGTPQVFERARSVAIMGRCDTPCVTGRLDAKQVDFGGGLVPDAEPELNGAGYLAILHADGTHRFSRAWPSSKLDPRSRTLGVEPLSIVSGTDGSFWWLVLYDGEIDLGDGVVLPHGEVQQVGLVRFAP